MYYFLSSRFIKRSRIDFPKNPVTPIYKSFIMNYNLILRKLFSIIGKRADILLC